MATRVVSKSEVDFAWYDNRDQVKLDIRKIVRRLEYEVLKELDVEFTAGINRGEILNLRPGEQSLTKLVSEKAKRLAIESGAENDNDD